MDEDDAQQRQLNIHLDPEHLAGVYSNFANISFSDYEFTLTFARIDHEVEDGDIPGVVVSRVNMSTKFMHELLEAMNDAYSKWQSREGIRNLPETSSGNDSYRVWISAGSSRGSSVPRARAASARRNTRSRSSARRTAWRAHGRSRRRD